MTSIIPMDCYKSYASLICQGAFPTCNNTSTTVIQYPCYSSCQHVLSIS